MGFFKDFKNDMKQAVNELIPGNEEMTGEYDDEDIVNTLEDSEYINTMDEPEETTAPMDRQSASEMESDDISLDDIEDFDFDEAELEADAGYDSDMDSLVNLLSGSMTVEDIEHQKPTHTEHTEKAEEESQEEFKPDLAGMESVAAFGEEPSEPEAFQPEELQPEELQPEAKSAHTIEDVEHIQKTETSEASDKEEQGMTEDKIIDITSVKEAEKVEPAEAPSITGTETEAAPEDAVSDSTTYITKGTRIEGNLFTDGSIDILGTVEGDVNCYGKLIISGGVHGKVNAGEIYANAAKIEGEINSAGSVKIGVGSVVLGNIEAQSAVIAGAVNGDVDVKGPVIVDSTAVIMGNIKSRSVQINNGAVIEGFCSQCYSDIDVKSFFA